MQTKRSSSSLLLFSWQNLLFCLGVSSLLLSGCGGSESDDIVFLSSTNDVNVALVSNGALATATYDPISAPNVNDGFTEPTSDFWSGIASGDSVTIDFGRVRYLNKITIFTNDTTFDLGDPNKRIEISTDITNSSNLNSTAQDSGGDISCASLIRSSVSITCTYSSRQQARFLRFTTLTTDLLRVVEMQAIGY